MNLLAAAHFKQPLTFLINNLFNTKKCFICTQIMFQIFRLCKSPIFWGSLINTKCGELDWKNFSKPFISMVLKKMLKMGQLFPNLETSNRQTISHILHIMWNTFEICKMPKNIIKYHNKRQIPSKLSLPQNHPSNVIAVQLRDWIPNN